MIFVTLGTQDKEFTRLVKVIDDYAKIVNNNNIIVQAGYTSYVSDKLKIIKFLTREEMVEYYKQADIVICHGGVGSILEALKYDKKVIAIPRLKKYNEHINDHQVQIVEKFTTDNYILTCADLNINNLKKTIEELNNFNPQKFQPNQDNFIKHIKKEIDKYF